MGYRMTGKRILVVDDDQGVRTFVEAVLAESGFEAVAVAGGAEALQALDRSAFDLLLTDIRMPEMDGFELVKRARRSHPGLRVLFISGYASEYPIDWARDDFLAKPFRPRHLLDRIDEILGRATR
jgi:DNA-binding response OmpR family regulator